LAHVLLTSLWLSTAVPLFFFYYHGDHRDLHSFPTRRSSDLAAQRRAPPAGPRSPRRARSGPAPRRSFRHPLQDLSLAELGQVARIPLVPTRDLWVADRELVAGAQVAEQQQEVRRPVGTGVTERRQAVDRAERDDRAALEEPARPGRGPAEHHHGPRDHPPPRLRSRVARHHDEPAAGGGARLGARVAPNDDLSAGHAAGGSRGRAARILPGAPMHVDAAARHRPAEVASHSAIDDQVAPGHAGPYAL